MQSKFADRSPAAGNELLVRIVQLPVAVPDLEAQQTQKAGRGGFDDVVACAERVILHRPVLGTAIGGDDSEPSVLCDVAACGMPKAAIEHHCSSCWSGTGYALHLVGDGRIGLLAIEVTSWHEASPAVLFREVGNHPHHIGASRRADGFSRLCFGR